MPSTKKKSNKRRGVRINTSSRKMSRKNNMRRKKRSRRMSAKKSRRINKSRNAGCWPFTCGNKPTPERQQEEEERLLQQLHTRQQRQHAEYNHAWRSYYNKQARQGRLHPPGTVCRTKPPGVSSIDQHRHQYGPEGFEIIKEQLESLARANKVRELTAMINALKDDTKRGAFPLPYDVLDVINRVSREKIYKQE